MKRTITMESKEDIHKIIAEYLTQNRLLKGGYIPHESSSLDDILATESSKQQLFNFASER
jgi:hypothetical protein